MKCLFLTEVKCLKSRANTLSPNISGSKVGREPKVQKCQENILGYTLFSRILGLNIFYLYTLYREQHIKIYINIQYTNGIQKKVFRLIRICIPFKISILLILSRF